MMSNRYNGHCSVLYADVVAAESRLAAARADFRAAMREAGVSVHGIFSSTAFVPRRVMEEKLADMEAANAKTTNAKALNAELSRAKDIAIERLRASHDQAPSYQDQVRATAAAIILAGKKRRGDES